MLNFEEASKAVLKEVPGKIKSAVLYKGKYIFQVIDDSDPIEGSMDPFYSVDDTTGKVEGFSIITDIDPSLYLNLVKNQNLVRR